MRNDGPISAIESDPQLRTFPPEVQARILADAHATHAPLQRRAPKPRPVSTTTPPRALSAPDPGIDASGDWDEPMMAPAPTLSAHARQLARQGQALVPPPPPSRPLSDMSRLGPLAAQGLAAGFETDPVIASAKQDVLGRAPLDLSDLRNGHLVGPLSRALPPPQDLSLADQLHHGGPGQQFPQPLSLPPEQYGSPVPAGDFDWPGAAAFGGGFVLGQAAGPTNLLMAPAYGAGRLVGAVLGGETGAMQSALDGNPGNLPEDFLQNALMGSVMGGHTPATVKPRRRAAVREPAVAAYEATSLPPPIEGSRTTPTLDGHPITPAPETAGGSALAPPPVPRRSAPAGRPNAAAPPAVIHAPGASRPLDYTADPAVINQRDWYHGTGTPEIRAADLDPNATRIDGLVGHGIYLTDNPDIAGSYANARGKRGTPTVYKAGVNVGKVLDLEKPMPADALPHFQRAADALGEDVRVAVDEAAQSPGATGETIYRAFSEAVGDGVHGRDFYPKDAAEVMQHLSADLKHVGYDAYTHIGGKHTGRDPHQVLIMLDPNDHLSGYTKDGQWHSGGEGRDRQIHAFEPMDVTQPNTPPLPKGARAGSIINPVVLMDRIARLVNDGRAEGGPRPSRRLSIEENQAYGQDAITKILAGRPLVSKAMHRNDVGFIDFLLGSRSHGIEHIIQKHVPPGEDPTGLLHQLVEVIAKGRIADVDTTLRRVGIELGDHRVVLQRHPRKEGHGAFMLTGYDKLASDESGEFNSREPALGAGRLETRATTPDLRSSDLQRSRSDEGAEADSNVAQPDPGSNPSNSPPAGARNGSIINPIAWPWALVKMMVDGRGEGGRHAADYTAGSPGGVEAFAREVLAGKATSNRYQYGTVPAHVANAIKAEHGVDVAGWHLAVDMAGVRHADNKHGAKAKTLQGNERRLAPSDYAYIPRAVEEGQITFEQPTHRGESMKTSEGNPGIAFELELPDGTLVVGKAIRGKKQQIVLQTMYKLDHVKGSSLHSGPMTPEGVPGASRPNRLRGTDEPIDTISQDLAPASRLPAVQRLNAPNGARRGSFTILDPVGASGGSDRRSLQGKIDALEKKRAAYEAAGQMEQADEAGRQIHILWDRMGPEPEAGGPRVDPNHVAASDYYNFRRANLSTEETAIRQASLQRVVSKMDHDPHQKVTWREDTDTALAIPWNDIDDRLRRPLKRGEALTRVEMVRFRLEEQALQDVIGHREAQAREALAQHDLGRHQELEDLIDVAEAEFDRINAFTMPSRSEKGRALNSLKRRFNGEWDAGYWSGKLRKAEGRTLTDAPRKGSRSASTEKKLNRTVAKGATAKRELDDAIRQLEALGIQGHGIDPNPGPRLHSEPPGLMATLFSHVKRLVRGERGEMDVDAINRWLEAKRRNPDADNPYPRVHVNDAIQALWERGQAASQRVAEAAGEVTEQIADAKTRPDSWWTVASDLRKSGLLAGLGTFELNTLSNPLNIALEATAKANPAALLTDVTMSLFNKGRRSILAPRPNIVFRSGYAAATKGTREFVEVMRQGMTVDQMAQMDVPKENNTGNKALDAWINFGFRASAAPDRWVKVYAYESSTREQCRLMAQNEARAVRKASGPTVDIAARERQLFDLQQTEHADPAITAQAIYDAEVATFAQTTVLGEAAKWSINKHSPVGWAKDPFDFAVNVVAPYKSVPSAMATSLLEYAIVGKGGIRVSKGELSRMVREGMTQAEQKAIAMAVGRGATGLALLLAGMALGRNGWITSSYEPETKQLNEVANRPSGALYAFGRWVPVGQLPGFNLLALGADLRNLTVDPAKVALGALKTITNIPMTQGVHDTADALNKPAKYGAKMVGSMAGSFIPSAVSDIAKATGTPGQPELSKDFPKNVRDGLAARTPDFVQTLTGGIIPGRSSLPKKQGALGDVVEGQSGLSTFNRLHGREARGDYDHEARELLRLGVEPSPPRRSVPVGKKSIPLTEPEQHVLWDMQGKLRRQRIAETMALSADKWNKAYKDEDMAAQQDLVKKAIQDADREALKAFRAGLGNTGDREDVADAKKDTKTQMRRQVTPSFPGLFPASGPTFVPNGTAAQSAPGAIQRGLAQPL